jgi:hypothetical protein
VGPGVAPPLFCWSVVAPRCGLGVVAPRCGLGVVAVAGLLGGGGGGALGGLSGGSRGGLPRKKLLKNT